MTKKFMMLALVFLLGFGIVGCQKEEPQEEETDAQQGDVVNDPEEEAEELFYVLYLKHKEFPYIFANTYTILDNDSRLEGKSLEQFVVEALIQQEDVDELINPIPEGTQVLSVEKENNTVAVDLSTEFVENMEGTEEDALITVAIIVNSLTTLPGNQSVQVLVEGSPIDDLLGANISEPFEFIEEYYPDK